MKDERNLYKVTNAKHKDFYVMASSPTAAANMAEKQWIDWNYLGDGKAIEIELIAQDKQYPAERTTWLLIEGG